MHCNVSKSQFIPAFRNADILDTKRAYGSKTDAYQDLIKMLENEHPPDDWNTLLEETKAESNRLKNINESFDNSRI